MKTYSEYESEFKEICNGKTMTGEEIIQWAFSRLNAPHKEVSIIADQIREKYIDTDKPLGKKVHYDINAWREDNGELGVDFGHGKEYVHIKRNLEMSPRKYRY